MNDKVYLDRPKNDFENEKVIDENSHRQIDKTRIDMVERYLTPSQQLIILY